MPKKKANHPSHIANRDGGPTLQKRSVRKVKPKTTSDKRSSFARQSELRKGKQAESRLTAEVFNFNGKITKFSLPEEVFKVEVAPQTLAQAVRVFLANQRIGAAKTKTRGEVAGGGRKPWRQKGTGRARAGSIRAPHFKGGGVVFGPRLRDFSLKLPKKVKPKALFGAISEKFAAGSMRIVDNFDKIKPETAELRKNLEKLNLAGKKVLWVVAGQSDNLIRAGRNLPNLSFCKAENLTTFQVMAAQILIFDKSAVEKLTERIN